MSKNKRRRDSAQHRTPTPISASPTQTPSKISLWPIAIILLAGLMSYSNVFHNQFLYDDEHYVVRNPYVRDFSHLKEMFTQNVGAGVHRPDNFYRPLQIFLYTVVYAIAGLSTPAYHALNLLIHFSNALFLWLLALSLSAPAPIAFAIALLFIVHPVNTEVVTYMNGTADPLATFWVLLGLLAHLRISRRGLRIVVVGLCGILGMLSKETAVVFPLLLVLVDLYRRKTDSASRWEWVPPWLLMGVYMTLRFTVFNFTKSLSLFQTSNIYTENLHYRIFTFFASLKEYAAVIFWPADLRYDRGLVVYTSPVYVPVLFGIAVVSIAMGMAWRSWNNKRSALLGWGWFFIGLGPVCGLVPINGFAMEHWLYLPMFGMLWIVIHLLARWVQSPMRIITLAILCAIPLGARTYRRNMDWKDPITFYSDILRHNPNMGRVHNNIAMAYAERGQMEDAIRHYQAAIALEDVYPESHHNLGQAYLQLGRVAEAKAEFERALMIQPQFFYAHLKLAEIYEREKNDAQARLHANAAQAILSSKK